MAIEILNLTKCIGKVNEAMKVDLTKPITVATILVKAAAKQLVAVDTGRLRSSISSRVFNKGHADVVGVVFTPVEYGIHQEYGTYKMSPQPFMRPAVRVHRKRIQNSIKDHIKSELVRISSK